MFMKQFVSLLARPARVACCSFRAFILMEKKILLIIAIHHPPEIHHPSIAPMAGLPGGPSPRLRLRLLRSLPRRGAGASARALHRAPTLGAVAGGPAAGPAAGGKTRRNIGETLTKGGKSGGKP